VIWQRSRPAEGTAVETYLRTARGYTGPIPLALRFTACKHPSDGRFHPAMIAIVVIEGCMKRPSQCIVPSSDGTAKERPTSIQTR
jgi:tRNA A37 methylthiotransferase MiaB